MRKTVSHLTAVLLSAAVLLFSGFPRVSAANYCLLGDADGDGRITSADARLILRCSVNLAPCSAAHLKIYDADSDGGVTSADARKVLRICVGLEKAPTERVFVFGDGEDADSAEKSLDGTFNFTVHGYGHGVGLSQWGAVEMAKRGYTYDKILTHYYSGTRIGDYCEYPAFTSYPGLGKTDTEQLVARIVYMEIYGIMDDKPYKEAIKAQAVAVFTLLAYYDFNVGNRWSVGIASEREYDKLPEVLRQAVKEVAGKYITVNGENEPILAVYSCLSAGTTASAQDIWGGTYPYLRAVDSPWDRQVKGFVSSRIYTAREMRSLVDEYDSTIVLSEDPSEWLEVIRRTKVPKSDTGYVVKIRVGNKILPGYNEFCMKLMKNKLRSASFTVTYIP